MTESAGDKPEFGSEDTIHAPDTLEVIQRSNATQEDGAFERRVNVLWDSQLESSWLKDWSDEREEFMALVNPTEPIWKAINDWGEGERKQFTTEEVEEMYALWLKLCEILRIDPGVDLSDCLGVEDLLIDWERYRREDEVVLDLTDEDPDSPLMQGLSALLRQDNLKKDAVFEEQRNAEALENVAKNDEGFLLFTERTSHFSLEIIQADEIDQGVSRDAWDKIVQDREVPKDALTTTYVLGPPEEMLRLERNPELREDDAFLEELRSQCLLYVLPETVLFGNKFEWTAQAFGMVLKRTNFNEQKALNGWDVGRTPVLGNHPSLPTVVDEELLELPSLWSPAGSGNHYFSISPQRLLEITKGKPGPRSRQYL